MCCFAAMLARGTAAGGAGAVPGDTAVAKWKHNKLGAFSMQFDDSMLSQADAGVPALVERGLVGTWYVNPGSSRYQDRVDVWETTCPDTGQELANHTMHHQGAQDYAEADYEIGECARIIWSLRPPDASQLMAFQRGGGTEWNVSEAEISEIQNTYHCITREGSRSMADEYGTDAAAMIGQAREAMDETSWVAVHFHGIGAEWIMISLDSFIELLDFLVSVEDDLWIGGYISVYKYREERETALVSVRDVTEDEIRLDLTSHMDPVLYDEPLTLITEVPGDWEACTISHEASTTPCPAIVDGFVQYEAVPGRGEIVIARDPGAVEAGIFRFGDPAYGAGEREGGIPIFVERTGGSAGRVSVTVEAADGTATEGSDYLAGAAVLTWEDADADSKIFTITILDDSQVEGDETVRLTLVNPTGNAEVGAPASATLTIMDDDGTDLHVEEGADADGDDGVDGEGDSGCSCAVEGPYREGFPALFLLAFLGFAVLRRPGRSRGT